MQGYRASSQADEKPKTDYGNSCTYVNVLKTTELYALNGSIVWYVNDRLLKLFFIKKNKIRFQTSYKKKNIRYLIN